MNYNTTNNPKNNKANNNNDSSTFELPILRLDELCLVPEELVQELPSSLKDLIKLFPTEHERSVALLSSFPLIASVLRNVKIEHNQGLVTPDLFVAIIAPAGSGKSAANKMKKIVSDTDIYKRREKNREGLSKSLFISANTSKRGLLDQLQINDGKGLIFDTEIDPIVSASNQDWGDFTDVMRKACEHQSIGIQRKNEGYWIEYPELSMCLTGTPGQFKRLFTSSEDGNFSRFAHFAYIAKTEWRSSNPRLNNTSSILDKCSKLSQVLLQLYKIAVSRESELIFRLSDDQWEMIDSVLGYHNEQALNGFYSKEIIPSFKRGPLLAVRMASIIELMTNPSIILSKNNPEGLSDRSLKIGIWLTQICLASAHELLTLLPGESSFVGKSQKFIQFYEGLPIEFSRQEALKVGESVGYADRTVGKHLTDLVSSGKLMRVDNGLYSKVTE